MPRPQKTTNKKTSKTSKPKGQFYSYNISSIAWSDGKTTVEKHLEVFDKDGKVSGHYQEKKNGKIVKQKKINNNTTITSHQFVGA